MAERTELNEATFSIAALAEQMEMVTALCDPLSEGMSDGIRLTELIKASRSLVNVLDTMLFPPRPMVGIFPKLTPEQLAGILDRMSPKETP